MPNRNWRKWKPNAVDLHSRCFDLNVFVKPPTPIGMGTSESHFSLWMSGDFWAWSVKILVFSSPVSYMLLSFGFFFNNNLRHTLKLLLKMVGNFPEVLNFNRLNFISNYRSVLPVHWFVNHWKAGTNFKISLLWWFSQMTLGRPLKMY